MANDMASDEEEDDQSEEEEGDDVGSFVGSFDKEKMEKEIKDSMFQLILVSTCIYIMPVKSF